MDGQTDRQTDGQTDVGHINLIGGLVTRNPPKNQKVAITHLAIGIDTQVTHHVVGMGKVAE